MTRRYAEGTSVSVAQSRGDITGILTTHGCERMGWMNEPKGDTLMFELGGRQYRFTIVKPTWDDVASRYVNRRDAAQQRTAVDAEWRRRWRAHVLLIKAKLEFADDGDVTTLEREFLPYAVLKDGRTLLDVIGTNGYPLLTTGAVK